MTSLPPPDQHDEFVVKATLLLLAAISIAYVTGWIVCFLTGGLR